MIGLPCVGHSFGVNPFKKSDLFVGGKYVRLGGFGTRTIIEICGDDVYWEDDLGTDGQCSRETFFRSVSEFAPDSPPRLVAVVPRARSMTKTVVAELHTLLPPLQKFLDAAGALPVHSNQNGGSMALGISLWNVQTTIAALCGYIKDISGREKGKPRAITRAESNASLLLVLLRSFSTVAASASGLPEADRRRLSEALTDAQQSATRIQSLLASCLSRSGGPGADTGGNG